MNDEWRAVGAEAARQLREGKYDEAALAFERLVAVRDDHADSWFNLGYARRMARQYEAALDAYAEAIARGMSSPEEAHLNRAVILSEFLHRASDAAAELRLAVKANPSAVPAWLNLGNLYEDLGDSGAAREAYEAALKADPRSGRAIARLAAIDVHQGRTEPAIAMLRDTLGRPSRSAEDAAEIHFALGNALDAAGEFSSAFQAISEANRISAGARPANLRYDPLAQEQLVDALIALPAPPPTDALAAEQSPIFICGMFRSGSTLVEQLLGRHPAISAGGELEFIPAMVAEDLQPYPQALAEASPERLGALRDKYLQQLHHLYPDAGRITDKRPDNFLHIGLIKALFPKARIVHTVRHPLDNFLSVFFLYFADTIRYSERLDDIAHYYAQYLQLMSHWHDLYGGDIHTVVYDRLVAEPRPELEGLLAFLGLAWDDACLDADAGSAIVRTASNWQVRQKLHTRSSGRWRNYAAELEGARHRLAAMGLLKA